MTAWVNNLYLVPNKSQTISFVILEAVLLWKTIYMFVCPKSPRRPGWVWTRFNSKGLTVIWECNNQLELSVYNMCCSDMVLTNPHVKPWIQFIIMKIFMKIVQICPKSPQFTVLHMPWSHLHANLSHNFTSHVWKFSLIGVGRGYLLADTGSMW